MPAIVLALVILAVGALAIAWFLRANPSSLARGMRRVLVVLGVIAVGSILIFGLRFVPSLLSVLDHCSRGSSPRRDPARVPTPG